MDRSFCSREIGVEMATARRRRAWRTILRDSQQQHCVLTELPVSIVGISVVLAERTLGEITTPLWMDRRFLSIVWLLLLSGPVYPPFLHLCLSTTLVSHPVLPQTTKEKQSGWYVQQRRDIYAPPFCLRRLSLSFLALLLFLSAVDLRTLGFDSESVVRR